MSPQKPKVIIFDLGGVLIDWWDGFVALSKLVDAPAKELHMFLQKYLKELELGNMRQEDFWGIVAQTYNYNGSPYELQKTWIFSQTKIEPTWKLVEQLNDKYRLFICTNNWLGTVENQVKNIAEFKYFELIIDSSQEHMKKPDINFYRQIEKEIGETPENILFIDDSERNCESAKTEGWNTFVFDLDNDRGQACCDALLSQLM